jgi:hypothetical protein
MTIRLSRLYQDVLVETMDGAVAVAVSVVGAVACDEQTLCRSGPNAKHSPLFTQFTCSRVAFTFLPCNLHADQVCASVPTQPFLIHWR